MDDGIYERSVQVNVFHLVELLLQRLIFKETTRFSFWESGRSINYLKRGLPIRVLEIFKLLLKLRKYIKNDITDYMHAHRYCIKV